MMNLTKRKIFAFALATMMVSLVGCTPSGNKQSESSFQANEVDTSNPDKESDSTQISESDIFSSMDTVDLEGNPVDSSVFSQNKLTLVNVWNVGCTPCVEEIPILDKLNQEYEEKGVAIKGLYYEFDSGLSDESRAEIEEILSKAESSYQQILTSKQMYESRVMEDLLAFPTTFFVDSNGKIVDVVEGSNDYEGWKNTIENVLKQVDDNE